LYFILVRFIFVALILNTGLLLTVTSIADNLCGSINVHDLQLSWNPKTHISTVNRIETRAPTVDARQEHLAHDIFSI